MESRGTWLLEKKNEYGPVLDPLTRSYLPFVAAMPTPGLRNEIAVQNAVQITHTPHPRVG